MSKLKTLEQGLSSFKNHYAQRLGKVESHTKDKGFGTKFEFSISSDRLKLGNHPRILHHGAKTNDVIILTHGLSDSPYYVEAIAQRFYQFGCNVVLPLLPGHGLKNPDDANEDYELDSKWKATLDNAVEVASGLGERISVGGFSTGGALSLNKILRTPELIDGGLFLFSAALDLGDVVETAGSFSFFQAITKLIDGEIKGIGTDPYKYPALPYFSGGELAQIINENDGFLRGIKLRQKAFAAHSVHDTTVKLDGIIKFLEHHVYKGMALIISENVSHSELVLDKDVELDLSQTAGPKIPPRANPKFDWMMDNALRWFEEELNNS